MKDRSLKERYMNKMYSDTIYGIEKVEEIAELTKESGSFVHRELEKLGVEVFEDIRQLNPEYHFEEIKNQSEVISKIASQVYEGNENQHDTKIIIDALDDLDGTKDEMKNLQLMITNLKNALQITEDEYKRKIEQEVREKQLIKRIIKN